MFSSRSEYRSTSNQCRPYRTPCCSLASSRSTTASIAPADSSRAKASCSSRPGGRPIKSNETRRNHVNLSAALSGARPWSRQASPIKASIGLGDEQMPRGTSGRTSGLSDQRLVLLVASLAQTTAGATTSHTQKNIDLETTRTVLREGAGLRRPFCPAGRKSPVRMLTNNITIRAQPQAPIRLVCQWPALFWNPQVQRTSLFPAVTKTTFKIREAYFLALVDQWLREVQVHPTVLETEIVIDVWDVQRAIGNLDDRDIGEPLRTGFENRHLFVSSRRAQGPQGKAAAETDS